MLAGITPLGERGRGARWTITTAVFIAGSTVGGAARGALLGQLGSVAFGGARTGWRVALIAAALAAGLTWELVRGAVPGPRRQVDERWLDRYRSWVYGLGFGVQLGAGIVTVVVTSAIYVVLVAAFVSADPAAAAVIGAVGGALRGATVLGAGTIVTPARLIAFHERMRTLHRPVRSAALAAQLALSVAAVAVAVGIG